ncbi:MAG: GAF domain-containing protein [Chloroflexota bacterium]
MSNKLKQEQLRQRLNSLFSEIVNEQEVDIPAISTHTNNTGWTWRASVDGIYTECSPEISELLGYKPSEVIGTDILEFGLTSHSQSKLTELLQRAEFPIEVALTFLTKYKLEVAIAFNIFDDKTENGQADGLRGFAQIIGDYDAGAVEPVSSDGEVILEEPIKREIEEEEVQSIPLESDSMAYQETASLDPSMVLNYLAKQEKDHVSATPLLIEPTKLELLEEIDKDPEREWTGEELLIVEQVADQLTLALENAKLFNQTQQALSDTDEQARRLRLLNDMSEQLGRVSELQEIMDITAQYIDVILRTDHTSISLFGDSTMEFEVISLNGDAGNIPAGTQLPMESTAIGNVVKSRTLINIPNLEDDLENIDSKASFEQGIRSTLLAPIFVSTKVVGTISTGSFKAKYFSGNEENLLTSISTIVSATIENRQLFDAVQGSLAESEKQSKRLKLLNEMSAQLSKVDTVEEISKIATDQTLEILGANVAGMVQLNINDSIGQLISISGDYNEALQPGSQISLTVKTALAIADKRIVASDSEVGFGRFTLIAPVFSGDEVICVLNIGSQQEVDFSSADQDMLTQITSLLSGTLENSRLFSQIQRRGAQLSASAQVSRLASGIIDSGDLLQQVIDSIQKGFSLYYAGLFLIDKDGDWTGEPNKWAVLQAGSGELGQQMLAAGHKLELGGDSMIGSSIVDGQARIALDVGAEAVFFQNPYLPETRSEMALPLIARGETLGALTIQSDQEAAFTQEDITALQTMADQVANSIENVNLFEQTQDRAEELGVLNEMARTFTQTLDFDTILENIYVYVSRLMDARNFYVALFDSQKDEIYIPLFKYHGDTHEDQGTRRKSGNGISEWIIRNGRPLLLREEALDWIKEEGLDIQDYEAKSWLGVPMLRGGEVSGIISVQSYYTARKYSTHHLDLLSAVANQAGIALENATLFAETQERARFEQERAESERLVRTITENVRRGGDMQEMLQIAINELGNAVGATKSIIKLGTREELLKNNKLGADTRELTEIET